MTYFIKNISRFVAFSALILLAACDEDTFSPIVEIEIPKHTPRLVIRADWEVGSDSLAVFVSSSKGVLDKNKANFNRIDSFFNGSGIVKYVHEYYDTVPNTKVELFRNDQLLGTIPYFNKGYHVAKKLFKIDSTSGVTYKIRVSAPGFETVEAEQKTQKKLNILRGGFKPDGAVYQDPQDPFSTPRKGDELTIELQDNADDENVYSIENSQRLWSGWFFLSVQRDTLNTTFQGTAYTQQIDPLVENSSLSDRSFNGKTYSWRIWVESSLFLIRPRFVQGAVNEIQGRIQSKDRVSFRMRSSNRDLYLFNKTLNLAREAQDNPFFSEPVILHTNVKNGYGIFTLSSTQAVTLTIL